MKIKQLQLGQRNDDGEFPVGLVIDFQNTGMMEARSVSVSAVLIDGGGFPIADATETDTSVSVGPGERLEWVLPGWAVSEHRLGGSSAAAGARASGVLRGREVLRLGVFEVPSEPSTYETFSKRVATEALDPEVKVTILRGKPDSDRQAQLQCVVSFRNRLDQAIDIVELKAELIDSGEESLDSRTELCSALPKRAACVNGSTNWVDDAKLRGASVRISLIVHRTIGRWHCDSRLGA